MKDLIVWIVAFIATAFVIFIVYVIGLTIWENPEPLKHALEQILPL